MIGGKAKIRPINKISFVILLLTAFVLVPVASFAQEDLPCGGDDPYANCPLDTGVWVLAVIGLIAGAIFLYRKQKIQHKQL